MVVYVYISHTVQIRVEVEILCELRKVLNLLLRTQSLKLIMENCAS